MLIRPRLSSMLFWSLMLTTATISAFFSQPATKRSPLLISRDGKDGYIDRAGKVIVPPQFSYAEDFVEGMARVQVGEQWTFINETGALMDKKFDKPFRFMDGFYNFSEGLAVTRVGGAEQRTPDGYNSVMVGGKYGFIDEAGKIVIPVSFDAAFAFSEGFAAVKKDAKWGFIDKTGRLALPAIYDRAGGFTGGLAAVMIQGKWGVINTKAQTVVQPAFDEIEGFHDGLARIMLAGKFGFVDVSGHTVIAPTYEYANPFSSGRALVRAGADGTFGYIDTTGKIVIPAKFGEADDFSDGLAAVKINRAYQDAPAAGAVWGYIDATGAYVITPRYNATHAFSEGLAAVSLTAGAQYGYIDHTGKMVIAPQFDLRAGLFTDGIARVYTDRDYKTRDEHGYVDRAGKFIWPFASAGKTPSAMKAQ